MAKKKKSMKKCGKSCSASCPCKKKGKKVPTPRAKKSMQRGAVKSQSMRKRSAY